MGALDYLPHYCYDDYKQWSGDWELIDGIAYAMAPSPSFTHQEINARIIFQLMQQIQECKHCKALAELDWKIDENTVVRPDTLLVCNVGNKRQFLSKTPQIIFEILSPSTKQKDRGLKYHLYESQGVEYYILVEPTGMFAEVYKLTNGHYRLEGEFKKENYRFELEECTIDFNFEAVFDIE
jgi:Uma2 family endonuclease